MKKRSIYFLFILCLLPLLLVVGCSDDDDKSIKIEGIQITNVNSDGFISVEKGSQFTIQTEITPSGAAEQLIFESGYTDVFTVNADGVLTALSDGEAVLTIRAEGNLDITAGCKVSVYSIPVAVESITFPDAQEGVLEISMGNKYVLNLEFLPAGATNKTCSWESSDETIFTIDDAGHITTISPGEAILTVTSLDGSGVVAKCTVRINRVMITDLKVAGSSSLVGGTTDITKLITVSPTTLTVADVEFTYSSSNPALAVVDEKGIITALAPGNVTITVNAQDGSGFSESMNLLVGTQLTLLDRSGFTVFASDQETSGGDGGGGEAILNDLTGDGNYWHSMWSASQAPLPHSLIVTMDKVNTISAISLTRRNGNTDTRTIEVLLSMDNRSYQPVGLAGFGDSQEDEMTLFFAPTETLYVKLLIEESNRPPFANLAIFRPYIVE